MKLQKLQLGCTYGLRVHEGYEKWQPVFAKQPASLNWTELNKGKISKKQRRQK